MPSSLTVAAAVVAALAVPCGCAQDSPARSPDPGAAPARRAAPSWTSWRGPQQDGTSREVGLPAQLVLDAEHGSWTHPLPGRGTPVIAGGRVWTLGYRGQREALQEVLVCLDERTGELLWEHAFTDFLTDIIYDRYSIGSPTIDPETGDVFCMSSAGLLSCFTAAGELVWQHALLCEFGRLTFPNGRTGAPLVDGDLVIVHTITAAWGAHAPARDRCYAFDKRTGESVWTSTPEGGPIDGSFSFPVVADRRGKRVLYAALGGGGLVCVDVRTGDPIWRYQMTSGGLSSSPVLYGDAVIAIHDKENIDDSRLGRMVAVRTDAEPEPGKGPVVLDRAAERWRCDLASFTSSPVLAGNRIYQTVATGELCCIDADSGAVLWQHKLAPDQIHASPVWADGRLFVPMNNGSFWVIRPNDQGAEVLQQMQLAGNCLGAPAIANGRVYVHTTEQLYCFGGGSGELAAAPARAPEDAGAAAVGPAVRLQVIPADAVARQGQSVPFRVRSLDAAGRVVDARVADVAWKGVPERGVAIDAGGVLAIDADAPPAGVVLQASAGALHGEARLRIVPVAPFADGFDDAVLAAPKEGGAASAPPRPYWVGAGRKWEIVELEGNKVLAKTLDNPLFQRTMSMIGDAVQSGCTVQVDILSDGSRRTMSSAGVINQRYLFVLKGNHQELEVSSNMELFKHVVAFRWQPKVWYTLKTRVDVAADGSAQLRAKVWPRGEGEPEAWMLDVPHAHAHTHGAPGIYGFTPQSRFRVYLDNLTVTPHG